MTYAFFLKYFYIHTSLLNVLKSSVDLQRHADLLMIIDYV